MKITGSPPPNYEAIIKVFPAAKDQPVVFTYGDTIFNVSRPSIPYHLIIHEQTHSKQQGNDPAGWWERYLSDPAFRTEQEVEAYAAQYAHVQSVTKDRNVLARALHSLALDLSSSVYGNVLRWSEAKDRIKNGNNQAKDSV